jgi:hypothetical protein
MIALNLNDAAELGEAIYASWLSVPSRIGINRSARRGPLWRDLDDAERAIWAEVARRLIALYRVEGMATGLLDSGTDKNHYEF